MKTGKKQRKKKGGDVENLGPPFKSPISSEIVRNGGKG